MRIRHTLAAILMIASGLAGTAGAQSPYPTPALLPGTVALSPGKSVDKQSWETFIGVVKPIAGEATFETWATDNEIYGPPPAQPGGGIGATDRKTGRRFNTKGLATVRALLHGGTPSPSGVIILPQLAVPCAQVAGEGTTPSATNNPGNFPVGCIAEEVRRDPKSTTYIVDHHLNSPEGLAENFAKSEPVVFPDGAIAVKADWIPVDNLLAWLNQNGKPATPQMIMANYYTATEQNVTYALVSMHISKKTKELPNWLWMTYEHQWNPGRCDTSGCYDEFGSTIASVASVANANTQYPDCAKSKELASLFSAAGLPAVWNNYCLKGSQIDYTSKPDGTGLATIDGDSVVERVLASVPIQGSSCISCHGTAAFTGLPKPFLAGINPRVSNNVLGPYTLPANYKAYDFMWGLINIPGTQSAPAPQFGP